MYSYFRVLSRTPMQRRSEGLVLGEGLTNDDAGRLAGELRTSGDGALIYWTEPMPLHRQAEILASGEAPVTLTIAA